MEKKEFNEMLVINQALGGKYDVLLTTIANGLGFDLMQFIGLSNFKEQLKKLLEAWVTQTGTIYIDAAHTEKYKTCHVDVNKLKVRITSKCNHKWKYIQALGERLNGAISEGMTLNQIKDSWRKTLIELKDEINLEVLKNSPIGSKGQRWKLTAAEMLNVQKSIKLNDVVTLEWLDNIDVAFVEQYPTFEEKMGKWKEVEEGHLRNYNREKGNYKVIQSELTKSKKKITCSSSALALKEQIIANVESYVKETPVPLSKALEIVQNSIVTINEPEYLEALFVELITNKQKIAKFRPPANMAEWLSDVALNKLPKEVCFEYYQAGIKAWIDNVKDAINVFYTGLKHPERYMLNTLKFKKHLTLLFSTEYGTEKTKLGVFINAIIKQFLDKAVEGKIKLEDFDKVWQESILLNDLSSLVLKTEFDLVYERLTEEEWGNINLPLILPQKSELIYACRESEWREPKENKKESEIIIPHPTPEPKVRANPLVVFSALGTEKFSLSIIDLDTNKEITEVLSLYGFDQYTLAGGTCQSGKKYQFILKYDDGTKGKETEVEILNGEEVVNILFVYKDVIVTQKILSYVVPFMPTMVEVYGGNGKLLQTITSFKSANDFSFECLSQTDLGEGSHYNSGAMDFSFKFIGDGNASDYWYSGIEYKTNFISTLVGFKVDSNVFNVIVDFPDEPWDAFISASKLAKDQLNKSLVVIKGKEKFLIGKGIHGGAPAYLHIRSKEKTVVIKKVDKAFSTDEWNVILNLGGKTNSTINYDVLELALSIELNNWVDDISYELINKLNVKIDKVAAPEVSKSGSIIEILKGFAGVLGAAGVRGAIAGAAIQAILVIVNEFINNVDWEKQPSKAEIISLFKKDVVDKMKEEISSKYTSIITDVINENPEIKTTQDCKNALMKEINSLLPNPKELIQKIDFD